MKISIVLVVLMLSMGTAWSAEQLIPYELLKKTEMGRVKMSVDVEVPLLRGRLPNAQELGAISNHIVNNEKAHERTFVSFYLPGMKVGSGAFATAHHNPNMKVNIMKYMLFQYPKYEKLAQ